MKIGGNGLTPEEKAIIKALIVKGWRNQDIHALINYERTTTINFGRIAGVKQGNVLAAADEVVEAYMRRKKSFDPVTRLNPYDDERLIRAREAMILAVTVFNNGSYKFKTEMFAVAANIAWTYLMHDYYEKKNISIRNTDGTTVALSNMLQRVDCPLSKGIKQNLSAIKLIRDAVEHQIYGHGDGHWLPLFQACCLNFDKTIVQFYGEHLSLQNNLSVALQFGKMTVDQLSQLQQYDIPESIKALDAALSAGKTEEELEDIEYQFKVVYTFDSASKGKSHIQFVHPESAEGKSIHNVLQKFKVADELYPFKPHHIVSRVREAGRKFSMSDHTVAWKKYKVRPIEGDTSKDKTNREFCIYHPAHKDYTYSQKWLDKMVAEAPEISPKPEDEYTLVGVTQ